MKKGIKKKIKRNLIISFVVALILMVKTAMQKKSLVCGFVVQNPNCPIYVWIIQLIILTLMIFILIGLIIFIIKSLFKRKKKSDDQEDEEEPEEEKETKKSTKKKAEKTVKDDGITLENGDEMVEKWPEEDEVVKI